jgi:hypothetical protein
MMRRLRNGRLRAAVFFLPKQKPPARGGRFGRALFFGLFRFGLLAIQPESCMSHSLYPDSALPVGARRRVTRHAPSCFNDITGRKKCQGEKNVFL